jgi:protein SMG8
VAQLMRVHVVTPKAPVHVTLSPAVVPCPDGPTFHPGWSRPVRLPISSYWVLRLPYIYQSNRPLRNSCVNYA